MPIEKPHATRSRVVRTIVLSLLGILLVWEVATRSIVAYLAEDAPEAALALRSTYPTALLNLADSKLNREQPPGSAASIDPDEAARLRGLAEQVLLQDPLNARALRIMGQLADGNKDEQQAERFMQAAVRRSLHESGAVYWLMRKSYDKADYGAAIRYADVLLRTRPQFIREVMPTLAAIAENKSASGALKQFLADNPPWRPQFFGHLPTAISDARTPLDLLLSLKETATPPTVADLRGYLDFLIANKFHQLAYYTWLQFLPVEQLSSAGLLFNGSFETKPSGSPFDWTMTAGFGVTIDIAAAPNRDGERALHIEFGQGRVDFRGVTQLILAAPGAYKFQGKYLGSIMARRGLRWRITCAASAAQLGESPMVLGATSIWKDFEFSFSVPKADCRGQQVRLFLDARSESEQFVSGFIWYDDLRIIRVE